MKRPKLPPHRWHYTARNATVFPLVLERGQLKHEPDTAWRSPVSVTGTLGECHTCGCLGFWGHYLDAAGQRQEVSLFGVEEESMTPMRTPGCELLSPPDALAMPEMLAGPGAQDTTVHDFARCA